MTTIGGASYRWRGKNIRTIKYKNISCATMPRKESVISAPADIKVDSFYNITIVAYNKGGNGKILVGFDDTVVESTYIVSKDFKEYSLDIYTDDIVFLINNLTISRPSDSTGSVVIKEIIYKEIPRPKSEEELELEQTDRKSKEQLRVQKKLGLSQAQKHKKHREEQSKKIVATRGDVVGKPVFIGGKGYRWKGKGIFSVFKYGLDCVTLKNMGSMVLVPVIIPPESDFEVNVAAEGSGRLMINFFGGRKFDALPATINVNCNQIVNYSVKIKSPKFPSSAKMYLRVWVIDRSKGSITIKNMTYSATAIDKKDKVKRRPAPILKSKIRAKPKPKVKFKPKESYDMKFKPYILNEKRTSDRAKEVLISNPNQVPFVSIITPTRDGLDLLRKCYEALSKNTAYPNWEWIVGDSDSSDGTGDFMKGLDDSRVKFVERNTTDGSFSSINNELARYASGEYILFLNDDTEPQPFWLYEMMSKIYNRPSTGIVGAKLMHSEKRVQHAGIMFMSNGPGNIGKPMLKSFKPHNGANFENSDRSLQAVTGACLLIRAEDFKNVGGFDPIYYFCYEDVDLCLKVKYNLNKKVIYAANAIILHAESKTQNKFKTGGDLQNEGIRVFKERWMKKVEIDMQKFMSNPKKNVSKIDVSFVTCVNNISQYTNYIVGSLFLNETKKNYEIIPIFNMENRYSAAKALNLGIDKARGDIVVLCHQDVAFYKGWVDSLFLRINEIGNKKWGVLGTAGISERDKTVGVVYNVKGKLQWRQTVKGSVYSVQTVDEHCMVIRKNSRLKFDEKNFNGFHCYGPDICLTALSRNMKNYGILCPLVHESSQGSLKSGQGEFMRLLKNLAKKWGKKFKRIRTSTSSIRKGNIQTFLKFK